MIQTDVYVPDFELIIDGRPLPTELRTSVMSIRFEEALEGAGRVEIQLANRGLRLLDHPGFDIDTSLRLALGYRPSNLGHVFSGTITGLELDIPSTEMPTLTVSAHDATRRLNEGKKQRAFPHYIPDAAIAAIVAFENGLIPRSDLAAAAVGGLGVFTKRPRYQYDQSDYDLLREIASAYGFDIWVDGGFLNLRLPLRELPPAEIELRYGESLVEFSPRLSSIGQLASVRVSMWVEALKTQLGVEVRWDGQRLGLRVSPVQFCEQKDESGATLTISDLATDTPVDAIRTALGVMRRRLNSGVTARGSAMGDPRFRVGNVVAIQGVGRRFSGRNYRLTSVAHSLDKGGYRTRFEVRRELV